jgi:hypothetical protein
MIPEELEAFRQLREEVNSLRVRIMKLEKKVNKDVSD